MHTMENGGKITPCKMPENSLVEIDRMEKAHHGKCKKNHTLENGRKFITRKHQDGKCTPCKMAEKSHPGKSKKNHDWKMPEWKMHTLENDRIESAHHGIC